MVGKNFSFIFPQDPSMSQMFESLANPSQNSQIEERMARIREDPSLKPILEEIETGGPAAMMRLVIRILETFPCDCKLFAKCGKNCKFVGMIFPAFRH